MNTNLGPSPGAARHPQHTVAITANDARWSAVLNGQVLAASEKALLVDESGFEPVVYFPPQDVYSELLQQSDSRSICPFKGEAGYFALEIDGAQKDVAWFYPAVYREVEALAGYVAFYADRVTVRSEIADEE